MKTAKFELPDGKWLVTVKDGRVKIKNMEGHVVLNKSSFLTVKEKANEASKVIAEIKAVI
ncbi:MAG: PQQ-dependent sugar dehydrogenase [Xanthomonadaceae bacterium]|nr:PQQ-dependent sugar dehydrogenase [Xanthomonadaceae bacterium]